MVGAPRLQISVDGRTVVIDPGHSAVIGRGGDCDVQLHDLRASRHHAVVHWDGATWRLDDSDSPNGTFCDGQRVSSVFLVGRTQVRFGHPTEGAAAEVELITTPAPSDSLLRTGPWPPPHPGALPSQEPHRLTPAGPPGPPLGQRSALRQPSAQGVTRIGRAPDNDLVVSDLLVSRHHAELRAADGGTWRIADVGSHNGTFVNGRRVQQAMVRPGDVIAIGHHLFRLTTGGQLEEFVDTGQVVFEARGLKVTTETGSVLLDQVSFSLPECSFLAVLGPTGAGKSTLINALTGFVPAGQGVVRYGGRDLYASYDELRRRIGYVPQDDILHPQLTVCSALRYAASLRFPPDLGVRERHQRVEEVMAELGLTERADLRISELSGGQRKRTSVALELLTRPSLLFLDEPTSGLDPGYEKSVMALLRKLADGGRTVVVVTHSVQSLNLCDRVLFLAPGGRTAFFGRPGDALPYFEAGDLADVFQQLDANHQADWAGRFRASPYARLAAPPAGAEAPGPAHPEAPRPADRKPGRAVGGSRSWFHQWHTLVGRYLRIIVADRRNTAILLAQAPILALLILAAMPAHSLLLHAPRSADPVSVLLVVVLTASWVGASNAIREIVKERPVLRRERAAGLSLSAYLASKATVLGGLTVLQAMVLVPIAMARQGALAHGAVLHSGGVELTITVALTGLAAMSLALFLSALSRTPDRALTVLPLILVAELLLSGAYFSVSSPGLAQASQLASAQWGLSAAASTVDLRVLLAVQYGAPVPAPGVVPPLPSVARGHPAWAHRRRTWIEDEGALVVLVLAALAGTGAVLDHADRTSHTSRAGRVERPNPVAG